MRQSWSQRTRQLHRWLSIVFTLAVVANFVALGVGPGDPSAWVTYSPLPPLALLLFSGLYLFLLPYARRWRAGKTARPEGSPSTMRPPNG
jgi:hypothetical protein